jgi:23S rRNA pseudouridine1911/1915/1917 synthase
MGNLCFIKDYSDLETALIDVLQCSKQLLKKYLSPKERHLKVIRGREYQITLNLLNHLRIHPGYALTPIQIIYQANEIMVVHKPHRVHCAPHSYLEHDNVLSWLRQQGILAPLKINPKSYERGLLHRLDYETSGLLLIAQNEDFYQVAFKNRESIFKKKYYLAIIAGELANGTYHSSVDIRQNTKVNFDPAGQTVSLTVETLLKSGKYSLLLVDLMQGHRHQIRFQLSQLNCSIVGDELYGGEISDRLYLHSLAYAIEIQNKLKLLSCQPNVLFYKFFNGDSALEVVANKIRSLEIG